MRIFTEPVALEGGYRLHPWQFSDADPRGRYYDFKLSPELIPTVLEDYLPLNHYTSVHKFYDLIKWLNSPGSPFETNDSRMAMAAKNNDFHLADKAQVRSGILMFFFRNLVFNLSEESEHWWDKYQRREVNENELNMRPSKSLVWLFSLLTKKLEGVNPDSLTDCISVRFAPVYYTEAPVGDAGRFGHEIIIKFWLWGDDDDEIMTNFSHTVSAMEQSLKAIAIQVWNSKQFKLKRP